MCTWKHDHLTSLPRVPVQENIHAYTLFARTEDEKNKWIEAIREALSNVIPSQRLNSTHEAAMHSFDK
jgi:hypothetical protein